VKFKKANSETSPAFMLSWLLNRERKSAACAGVKPFLAIETGRKSGSKPEE
jgi:hypothetical protein